MAKSVDMRAGARGLGRHLEGWQPGLVAVVLAGSVALLAVPRSVPPSDLPMPLVEPARLREIERADEVAARSAERHELDPDVRALGSLLRAFGRAEASGDEPKLIHLRSEIASASARARVQGEGPLLELRAFQLRAFLREVRRFAVTGEASAELVELGGTFADMLRRNGWCEGSGRCVLRMDEAALRASFKRRWCEISGLSGGALDLAKDEQRALSRFLFAHPPRARDDVGASRRDGSESAFLLRKIDELAALDPSYPRDLARGIVHFRKGDSRRAAAFFATYLEASPDGPWSLRAQNYLRAALERSVDENP